MRYLAIAAFIVLSSCKLDTYRCECYTDKLVETKEIKANKHNVADYECKQYNVEVHKTYPVVDCYLNQ